jgi:hypothetical protein
LPTQSAGNRIILRWRQISEKKELLSPQWELQPKHLTSSRPPLISHYPLPLSIFSVKISDLRSLKRVTRSIFKISSHFKGASYNIEFDFFIHLEKKIVKETAHVQKVPIYNYRLLNKFPSRDTILLNAEKVQYNKNANANAYCKTKSYTVLYIRKIILYTSKIRNMVRLGRHFPNLS